MTVFADILKYARAHKKLWMVPFLLLLLGVGVLIILAETTSIGPFIYALF